MRLARKRTAWLGLVLLALLALTGCLGKKQTPAPGGTTPAPGGGGAATTPAPATGPRVGIVLSTGGKGDKAFNDAAIRGLEQAKSELGISYRAIEPKEMANDESALSFLSKEKYDLIIGVGFLMGDAMKKVATANPDRKYAIIDYEVDAPNVTSLVFTEHEGSFLAGALAALTSKTGTVGFIGGMNSPLINRFEGGFTAGAKYARKDVKVLSNYAADDPKGFNDPARGKELALSQYRQGADVIYHAAGGTGSGVFEAAREQKRYAIGVDSNQNWVQPGFVIASMLKRVDVAVLENVRALKGGTWKGGVQVFGLKENGMALTSLDKLDPEETTVPADQQAAIMAAKNAIPAEAKTRIPQIRDGIIKGEIKVPDWIKGKTPIS